MNTIRQGDILKIEGIKFPVYVASKDFFNSTEEIIGCAITSSATLNPLRFFIITDSFSGYVHCEKIKLLDLKTRGFSIISHVCQNDIMEISDIIQGIFDYI